MTHKNNFDNLRVLSAKGAAIRGVLGNFHLLDDLTEGSTISGSVLTANSDLLRVVSLGEEANVNVK